MSFCDAEEFSGGDISCVTRDAVSEWMLNGRGHCTLMNSKQSVSKIGNALKKVQSPDWKPKVSQTPKLSKEKWL